MLSSSNAIVEGPLALHTDKCICLDRRKKIVQGMRLIRKFVNEERMACKLTSLLLLSSCRPVTQRKGLDMEMHNKSFSFTGSYATFLFCKIYLYLYMNFCFKTRY